MSPKAIYLVAATVGGTVGGFIPMLWGDSGLGAWSILTSTVGGLVAIWLSYRYLIA